MARGLKFIGIFFVFLFTGVLIAGVVAGNLEIKKDIPSSLNNEEPWKQISDTANLKVWISHLQRIAPGEIEGTYKIYLHTGKPQAAVMDLLPMADSTKRTMQYRISNKGSELNVFFKVLDKKVAVSYTVEGKGTANKIVLAMLRKSLKDQYNKEMQRIEQLLNNQ
jgi:hypothetical protein